MTESPNGKQYLDSLKEQRGNEYRYYETFYLERLERKARANGIPMNGQFELTPLCNFDCKMCYTHLTPEQMAGKPLLTVEQWKSLTDQASRAGLMRVNLTGGECLTYPGFEELYLYLHSLGIETRVLTNGALLDDRWIAFFRAHPPILLQITLYGGDEDTYERVTGRRQFAVVSENIRRLAETDIPVTIALTPSKYMGDGMFKTIRAAHDFGLPYAATSYLTDPKEATGRAGQVHELSPEEYVAFFRYRNQLRGTQIDPIDPDLLPPPGGPHHECSLCGLDCAAGLSAFDIAWDGTMTLCNEYRDLVTRPLEEGFDACWEKLHRVAAGWPRVPECIGCSYKDVCTNCEIRKASVAGAPGKQPLALCERTRYLVRHGVYEIPACE